LISAEGWWGERSGGSVNGKSYTRKTGYYKCHFLNTYVYAKLVEKGRYSHTRVRKWTDKVDVFDFDKVIIPCNLNNNHWVTAVVDNEKKRIEILDSLDGENASLKQNLLRWLQEEHIIRKGNALSAEWTAWSPPSESLFPRQRNGYDCWVFTCMYAAWASIPNSSTDFSQMDIPYLRK